MPSLSTSTALLTIAVILLFASPAHAFGAGNIASVSKIEGLNWRHGDIEDTLLTLVMSRAAGGKKFDKMSVARVYFGNWLRDYSQAVDVGTVKYVSAEAIRILLWVLGFMTFGFGTKEFEVTTERLGCYRPEDHIDNPKDYADNLDATQYDRRLRGPVDERVELAIDPYTGMKNYIANERAGCMTSALHVRRLFGRCIQLGRSYNRSQNKEELYEALRLLGTGLHCLEDYSAHSNYVELALLEMGERDVFPYVGANTQIRLQGARGGVFPLVTGTFGGVDFLHSVMGEVSDKATQSEIQELEGTIQHSGRADTSQLKDLLNSIPRGLFGNKDEASAADEVQANATAAQMNQMRVSPRRPEEFTRQMQEVSRQIYPIIEWHDEIMLSITEAVEKIPVLPDLLEQLQEQISVFVFSLIAPFVLPIISAIKAELETGSSEIIQSSKAQQLNVFHDDRATDPTHSMLSKDHFSNILNEPAGKIASQVLKWVVPQIIQCWDDERADVDRTLNRIIAGVFHHPAQRDMGEDGASDGRRQMFGVVEQWWSEQGQRGQQQLRRQLSSQGVQNGENHKPGVHDKGHGCGKPLGMAKTKFGGSGSGGLMGGISSAMGGMSGMGGSSSGRQNSGFDAGISKMASQAAGGGALGGLVGALAGGVGGSLLSGAFGGGTEEKKVKKSSYDNEGYTQDGGYKQSHTEYGHSENTYAQAQYSQTQRPGGVQQTEFSRYEQTGYGEGVGFQQRTETHPTYGGGYEQTTERRYEREGGEVRTEKYKEHKERRSGSHDRDSKHKKEKKYKSRDDDSEDDDDSRDSDEEKKRRKKEKKKREKEQKYGRKKDSDDENDEPKRYGGGSSSGYGGREEYGSGRQEYSSSRDEYSSGQQYGGGREEYGSGRKEYSGGNQYGEGRQEYSSGRDEYSRGDEYGGGRNEYDSRRDDYGRGTSYGNSGYGEGRGYQAQPSQRTEYGQGGYGGGYGEQGYGGGRRRDDDDDDDRRGQGYSQGYGGGVGGGWGY